MFATVVLDISVDKAFDYQIPLALNGKLRVGHLVQVPFKTSLQPAIVIAMRHKSEIPQPKSILDLLHPEPVLNDQQITLAQAISRMYLAPIGLCVWSFLPPGTVSQRDIVVTLIDRKDVQTGLEREIVALLNRRGSLRGRQLDLALPGKQWRPAVDALVKSGIVMRESILIPARIRPKVIQTAMLAISPQEIEAGLRGLERTSLPADALELIAHATTPMDADLVRRQTGASSAQLNTLVEQGWLTRHPGNLLTTSRPHTEINDHLASLRGISRPAHILRILAREGKPMDVSWIYAQTDSDLQHLKRLEKHELITLGEKEVWRDSLAKREFVPTTAPPLTPEQADVWASLSTAIQSMQSHRFLLHGVTGSGKTELYLRAIQATLMQGRSAIFLVPEIALTAQTVRRVAARFPGQTAIIHSKLSEGERYDTWRRARMGLFRIAVGPRSALFAPLPDIGLIILDEEHDHSYKQSGEQQPPHYHARAVAEMIVEANNGVLILGSATPSVETLYRAEQGEIDRLVLPTRILGHRVRIHEQEEQAGVLSRYRPAPADDALTIDLPPVEIVDMRQELKAGNTSIFSHALQSGLRDVLARHEQALLLMNRRGQATYVFCRDCGYVAACPRCDTPLTFHREGTALRCHRCGFSQPEPSQCPQCQSRRIKFFGAGTQQVEQTLKTLFPHVRVIRWDADSASTPGAHEAILQHFIDRYADVVVGTQMIAKGLDLPLVTLVGIVNADVSLNLPDFRAAERSFQLLTQAAGRAGRGLLGGKVILQTYEPEHYVIAAAARHDTLGFYRQEIAHRRELGYPPFRRLVRLIFTFPQEAQARAEAERAAGVVHHRMQKLGLTNTELIGPAPCFFTRNNQNYRWHVLLRGPDPAAVLRDFELPSGWHIDVDPVEVL